MTHGFSVQVTATFEREYRKLLKGHPDLTTYIARAIGALAQDPYNSDHRHPIKRLIAVKPGNGQYRIRYVRYRFIFDIEGQTVYFKHCSVRREDTYK